MDELGIAANYGLHAQHLLHAWLNYMLEIRLHCDWTASNVKRLIVWSGRHNATVHLLKDGIAQDTNDSSKLHDCSVTVTTHSPRLWPWELAPLDRQSWNSCRSIACRFIKVPTSSRKFSSSLTQSLLSCQLSVHLLSESRLLLLNLSSRSPSLMTSLYFLQHTSIVTFSSLVFARVLCLLWKASISLTLGTHSWKCADTK